jgi:phage terminase small subunit
MGKRTTAKKVATEDARPVTLPTVEVRADVDTDGFGDDGLTIRQRAFVAALVGPAGGNATKAAEMAGYASENRNALMVTACRLLSFAKVAEAITHALAARNASPEWAKLQLIDAAGSSLANFVTVNESGEPRLDFKKAAEAGAMGQLKEFHHEVIKVDGAAGETIKTTIKVHDRMTAIQTLLKLHGLLIDRRDVTSGDKPIKSCVGIDDGDETTGDTVER